jgi:pimeloyl-ACP methyl ester carboxylesterase
LNPDPYGRWICAGQYLPLTPGFEDSGDIAAALRTLALEAGRLRVYAGDPVLDPVKERLRVTIDAERRPLYDIFAHRADSMPRDDPETRDIATRIAHAAVTVEPRLDPTSFLPRIDTPVLIAHGRDDRLIPFTESIRLGRAVPASALERCEVTGLFAHSGGTQEGLGVLGTMTEAVRFASLMRAVLTLL